MPQLFAKVTEALDLGSSSVPGHERGSAAVALLLDGLATTVTGVATERNAIGTGHGSGVANPAEPRHAYLAFNATVAVAEYLVDSWMALEQPI